jgi:uncharacterized protein (DUF2062 family)
VVKRLKRWMPTREQLEANRFLRPFAHWLGNPMVWRFHRKGVARGIALGLFLGFLLPFGLQTPLAVALAVGVRANLPIAVLGTTISNPFTFPLIYFLAYKTGAALLKFKEDADRILVSTPPDTIFDRGWTWLTSTAGPTYLGLTLFAVGSALAGYWLVNTVWRLSVSGKWRRRRLPIPPKVPPKEPAI